MIAGPLFRARAVYMLAPYVMPAPPCPASRISIRETMILALETSSTLCAVCLYDEAARHIVSEVSNDIGRGHAERLMDDISDVLKLAGLAYKDLTMFACGVGPGSFTGIRVGVAAARGFGLALKVPVHGVTSMQAIVLQAAPYSDGASILAAMDAGRDEVYVQLFDGKAVPLNEAAAVRVEDLSGSVPAGPVMICGSGAAHFPGQTVNSGIIGPTASAVAMAAAHPAMRVPPKPLYLREPDAKPQAGFAVARQ
jgi:tRNA threonylcarbamoyladenosine biosynthesis protein TsaB